MNCKYFIQIFSKHYVNRILHMFKSHKFIKENESRCQTKAEPDRKIISSLSNSDKVITAQ